MDLLRKDVLAGIFFVCLGIAVAIASTGYRMGQLSAMGPGFFPFWLGLILAFFGAVVTVGGVVSARADDTAEDQRPERWNLKALALVLGAIVLFGLALQPLGIGGAVAAVVLVSSYASTEFTPLATVLNALVLSGLAIALFVFGLGLPLPVLPSFLGG